MSSGTFYGAPGKMTRRLLGVVIGTQGLVVFFGGLVARSLAAASGAHTAGRFLVAGSLLAVLCILDAGLLRRSWGITAGWVLQIATLGCALIVPAMMLVGVLFGALWVTALVQGRKMDEHTRAVDARWYAAHPTSSAETPLTETSATETSATEASATEASATETSATETSATETVGQSD